MVQSDVLSKILMKIAVHLNIKHYILESVRVISYDTDT